VAEVTGLESDVEVCMEAPTVECSVFAVGEKAWAGVLESGS
jgi:hypothetical protein